MKKLYSSMLVLIVSLGIFTASQAIQGSNNLTEQDKQFMKLAIEKAGEGVKEGGSPFGACIVKDGKVVLMTHSFLMLTQQK